MSKIPPHMRDWTIGGNRGLLVMGFDPNLYPENERVAVAQVNPSGEASPVVDEDWARLIAAAPFLLEALQCLVHRCDAEECGTTWAPLTDARKAIAAATGEAE